MSTTFQQDSLVRGYCRQMQWIMIETLVRLISLYFIIPECWSVNHGEHIQLDDNNEYCEYSWNQYLISWYHQESVYGNVIIEPYSTVKSIVRWRCEYFMLHHSSFPLFIGVCNYTTFKYCGPHIEEFKRNYDDRYIGYGISFGNREINDPWCKPIQSCKGVCSNSLEFERNIYIKKEFDDKYIDNLAFGEMELMVIIENATIEVIMKLYTHPNTCKKSSDYLRKTQFQNTKINKFWLTASLPMGSGLKIKSFEAYGLMNVEFRDSK